MTDQEPPTPTHLTAASAVERLRAHARDRPRTIVGLCGPPGAGKSTLAAQLVAALGRDVAVALPMDGFHLANSTLERLGLRDVKGAIETFDAGGFTHLLTRLAVHDESVVYAPEFDRRLEEPVAGTIRIAAAVPIVIVEGNYLLADADQWSQARAHLDETWYLQVDDEVRRRRLVARHVAHGRSPTQAEEWVSRVDDVNTALVAATAHRADAVLEVA